MMDKVALGECRALIESRRGEIIGLCQDMVRVPSLSGEEGAVADLVLGAMQRLDYDETWVDPAGNVIGVVRGGDGPTTMFNGHMDVVDPGNPDDWPYPPFTAQIDSGRLWGRGSADMKGPLAAMIYAAGLFKAWNRLPKGDIVVCAVGLEEVGGWGTQLLLEKNDLRADRAVVGEPTDNRLLPGHRGRIILKVHVKGLSRHGSLASVDVNPLFSLAGFLHTLPGVTATLAKRASYLTITPTAIAAPSTSPNVTLSEVTQTLDVRVGPDLEAEQILGELNQLLERRLGGECSGLVAVARQRLKTYTGVEMEVDDWVPGYQLPGDHSWAREAGARLGAVLAGHAFGELARFACDACRLGQAGIPTFMFGPGDIALAHTTGEYIPIEQLLEGVVSYMALVL